MFDTNIYQSLYDAHQEKILKLVQSGKLVVYGCKTIRDELRDIPKHVKYDGKGLRNLLLQIYDGLVKNHSYPVGKPIETLAEEYWSDYQGGVSKRKIFPDFLIVATATIHKLDIIVSHDDKTMKSKVAIKAYKKTNERNGFETPDFIPLEKLN